MKRIVTIFMLLIWVSMSSIVLATTNTSKKTQQKDKEVSLNEQINVLHVRIDSLNMAYQKSIELVKKEQDEKYIHYYNQLDSDLDRFLIYMSIFWGVMGIVLGLFLPLLLNSKAEKRIQDDINNLKNLVDQQLKNQNRIMASRLREQYKEIDTKIQNQNNIFGKRFAQHKAYIDKVSIEVESYVKQSKINSLLTQAQTIVKTTPEEAISLYTQILDIDKTNEMALLWRGIAYELMQKDFEALIDLNKVLEINPRNARAYNNIGNIYARTDQYGPAIQSYMKGLEIDPRYANIYGNLSRLEASRKQLEKAIEYINKALSIDDTNRDFHAIKKSIYTNILKNETDELKKAKYVNIVKEETEIINRLNSKS